jgi:uncharacterized membrane protein YkgB
MNKLKLLSISIGIIYFWFGALKFFHGMSPAFALAGETIEKLSFGLIHEELGNFLLACIEVLIGVGLIFQKYKRTVIIAALIHMGFTFTPLLLLPELSFTQAPFGFTIVGQYIMKNIVIIMALVILLPSNKFKEA